MGYTIGEYAANRDALLQKIIFLSGLSGSGKSTIGRQTANLLGWHFVDTDDLIAERVGLPVGQVLVEYGEERFRAIETEALLSAADQERVVIATGGGVVISEANRAFMQDQGLTVYLQVSVETAWRRVQEHLQHSGNTAVRPLLSGENGQQRLQDLFLARRQQYEQALLHINTDEQAPDILACQIVAGALAYGYLAASTATTEEITLHLGTVSSRAEVRWGSLHYLPQALQSSGLPKRVFIVTDTEVGRFYAEPVKALLEKAGFMLHVFSVPAGESSKSFLCLQQILDWLVEHRAERQEAIIALGGGVAGDLAGFVAACYQRGVPFIQVPTTLLAQVDSAIGGKTGINHPLGKNLIGAFYQPKLIVVDPGCLLTLPERVYREGWAEIVKYGMILDTELFELIEGNVPAVYSKDAALLTPIIARCIRLKMDVVQRDEREGGLRTLLNYGHTFGHALEAIMGYGTLLHGEAVSIGMEVAAQIAVAQGLLSSENAARQHELLCSLGLPVSCPGINMEVAMNAMLRDKKVQDGRMRWVLPTRIGHGDLYNDVPLQVVKDVLTAVCSA